MEQEKEFYSPKETAAILGVSRARLNQMREQGRIQGTPVGNMTLYTREQIQMADTSTWKRGPKPKNAKKNGGEGERSGNGVNPPCDAHAIYWSESAFSIPSLSAVGTATGTVPSCSSPVLVGVA